MSNYIGAVLVLLLLFIVKMLTGPILYHIFKIGFWVLFAYVTGEKAWAFLAAWDMVWIIIWGDREPYRSLNE